MTCAFYISLSYSSHYMYSTKRIPLRPVTSTLSISYPSLLVMLKVRPLLCAGTNTRSWRRGMFRQLLHATYLKPVGAGHLLLRDNCLWHHTERWAHRRWVRPQDGRHHGTWCEVGAESATHLRHRSQVRVRCLPSTERRDRKKERLTTSLVTNTVTPKQGTANTS